MWRLVLDAKMDYNTVFNQMLPSEIAEANAALTIYPSSVICAYLMDFPP